MPLKDSTLIVAILDRSGSMQPLRQATITGFNEFLEGQKAAPGEAQLSLIQFDHQYEVNYLAKPIKDAAPLTMETYSPRGNTALLDAIGRAIIETGKTLAGLPEASRPEKVIIVIDTDGAENASTEFDHKKIGGMIHHQTDVYKWEFIFLGANQDAIMTAGQMGIKAAHAMNTQASVRGTGSKFAAASAYVTRSRVATMDSMGKNSFTKEERADNA